MGGQTEEELLHRIQGQQNPVKKAKDEIKLASLKLTQVQGAYSQDHVDEGAKLLGVFVDDMKTSWKLLQDSGRNAAKQPDGFRELEIALREDVRSLQDLERTVSYFRSSPFGSGANIGPDAKRSSPSTFPRGQTGESSRFTLFADDHQPGKSHGSAVIAVCAP